MTVTPGTRRIRAALLRAAHTGGWETGSRAVSEQPTALGGRWLLQAQEAAADCSTAASTSPCVSPASADRHAQLKERTPLPPARPDRVVTGADGLARPPWAAADPLLGDYYDTE
jgi:hypothetical protein